MNDYFCITSIKERLIERGLYGAYIMPFVQKMVHYMMDHEGMVNEGAIYRFCGLFHQYFGGSHQQIDWDYIQPLDAKDSVYYERLPISKSTFSLQSLLSQTLILKLNGGLGTSMGLDRAKSTLVVDHQGGRTFLDFIGLQVNHINQKYDTEVKLSFLNSVSTRQSTHDSWKDSSHSSVSFEEIFQYCFPRIELKEVDSDMKSYHPFLFDGHPDEEWAPPGHGEIYQILYSEDYLANMLQAGKRYLFISNADNLGATLDPVILNYIADNKIDFLAEATVKTLADVKGGAFVRYRGRPYLLERAQVMEDHLTEFEDVKRFSLFNTNNVWIRLEALYDAIQQNQFDLPLIVNQKMIQGHRIVQLETALGAALSFFRRTQVLVVPRRRFLPVKHNSDLLLLRSDYILKSTGDVQVNPKRLNPDVLPIICLSSHYHVFSDFEARIQAVPSLVNIDYLELDGDISIDARASVVFAGSVLIRTDLVPIRIVGDVHLTNVTIEIRKGKIDIGDFPDVVGHIQVEKVNDQYQVRGIDLWGQMWQVYLEISDDAYLLKAGG